MDEPTQLTATAFQRAGQELLQRSEPLAAYDALADGLRQFPGDVRLRQLTALALARSGASQLASPILHELLREGHEDEETLGLLARTHKDLWAASIDASERRRHLEQASHFYLVAHRAFGGIWSGINAATMALLLGDAQTATALALSVREQCRLNLRADPSAGDDYWTVATLGEAALILQDWPQAEDWYARASALGATHLGDLASTRRNARLILCHLQAGGARIEACLRIPNVVLCAGHLIDRPDRTEPRFPPELEPAVRSAIGDRLREVGVGFGYASAACGADILFLESVLELGGEAHVILPYDRERFVEDSVDLGPGTDWIGRFERVLAGAHDVHTASHHRMGTGGVSYEYGFLLMDGAAALRADELDTELVCLAVWDGKPGDAVGGTATAVARWRRARRRVEVIDLAEIMRRQTPLIIAPQSATPAPDADTDAGVAPGPRATASNDAGPVCEPEIVGLLFADARGFSKLTDADIPIFVEHYLSIVVRKLEAVEQEPLLRNTWGDGLYLAFRNVRDAGIFALDLCEAVRDTDWQAKGLSTDLSLRIGLHAGPAYSCIDPVTGRPNIFGAHVSQAARIEPITPPGHVYASGAFAALARADEVREFVCAYVGRTPLAKSYGAFPTYVLHRRREPARERP